MTRRVARASLLFAALFTAACVEVKDASDEAAKKAAGDSGGGGVFIGEAKPNATTPSPDTYGPDSATPVRGFGPVKIEAALRTDSTRTIEVIDSTPAAMPTDADLSALRREIAIPVAGVGKSALRDTYDEMRGGIRKHEALDILAPRGTAVLSATPGRVLKLFTSTAGGLMIYAADSTERRRHGARGQHIRGIGARSDRHEQRAEQQALHHRRRGRVDELRQERGEEEGGLRVQQRDDECVAKHAAQSVCRLRARAGRGRCGAQRLDAQHDEVGRAGQLDDAERERRDRQQRRQPERCGQRVAEIAERHTGHRGQPRAPTLRQRARDDVQNARPRRGSEHQAREHEREQERGRKIV